MISLAGHIDHGKSALVQALTGGIVDRLPEEKRRGMTIDLGFAHCDIGRIRFAFIDVPGHERFIHTMLAGASGVDLALLVVAADDSVMPQTREHLAVLELLGVRLGLVALTKCDLVDDEQLELVHLEVAELVEPTFLARAPVIATSARTGLGIVELQQAFVEIARQVPIRATGDSRFRLPIDRVFSPSGQGTIVTGTVWRGTARVGDTLDLLPASTPVRIRRLQSQGVDVDIVSAGERAAINLPGIKASAIRRGDELATPQAFEPSRRHLVHLRCLRDAGHGLKHRDSVRIHLGANQVTAQLLIGQRAVSPGEGAFAVLRCGAPIVAEYGQPFVIRQLSPAHTIGGGTVIAPALRPSDRMVRCLDAASDLSNPDPGVRLAAYVDLRREAEFDSAIESRVGLSRQRCEAVAQELLDRKALVRAAGPQPRYVTSRRFDRLKQQMIGQCQIEAVRLRPAWQVPIARVLSGMSRQASAPLLDAVLDDLTRQGELLRRGDRIGRPAGAELSHRQRGLLDLLLAECIDAGRTPPSLKEFAERNGSSLRDLEPLVQVAVDEGRLDRLLPELAIDHTALEELRKNLADYFQEHPAVRISEIREHWGMTRKHAVPIFEFFDQQQVTVRSGDVRTAGPRLGVPIHEAAP
ncbi:MAG TPA: selenocysteine-specific translation elongation factor [Planctomycetaceae bacterium]|nr:selenocysteine-specific translation elongation factor [Planctomycetaceae bacterium]